MDFLLEIGIILLILFYIGMGIFIFKIEPTLYQKDYYWKWRYRFKRLLKWRL